MKHGETPEIGWLPDWHAIICDHPATLFKGSIATPSLEAAIINAKYVNSNPLDRVARDFQTNGLNLSKQTMSNWTVWSAERYFFPVYDLMKKRQFSARVNLTRPLWR